jgi:hypothetical protein
MITITHILICPLKIHFNCKFSFKTCSKKLFYVIVTGVVLKNGGREAGPLIFLPFSYSACRVAFAMCWHRDIGSLISILF